MSRWTLFLLVIILGLALGLVYGWVINPVSFQDTTLNNLRIDYKTDYTLWWLKYTTRLKIWSGLSTA